MDIFSDWIVNIIGFFPTDGFDGNTLLAQTINDPDLLGQVQRSFTNFIKTGQAWALLIGLAIGYMIRNLTSYG